MAQITWTEPALAELNEIAEYIALDNFNAAQSLVRSCFDRVDQLMTQPKSGRKPPELSKSTIYREVIVGPCRIFYRLEQDQIIIVYVMRNEKALRRFILEDRATT